MKYNIEKIKYIIKWIIHKIILIPNIPFHIVFSIIIIIKIFLNNNISEILLLSDDEIIDEEMECYLEKLYPRSYSIVTSITFYVCIYIKYIF